MKTTTEPVPVVDLLLRAQIDRCIQSPEFCNFPWLGGTNVAKKLTTATTTMSSISTTTIAIPITTTRAPVVVDLLLKAQIDRCIQSPKFCYVPWLGGTDVAVEKFTTATTTISTTSSTTTTALTTTTRAPVVDLLLKAQIDRCIQSSICNI